MTQQYIDIEKNAPQVELRRAIRYSLAAPVVFTWTAPGAHRFQGAGVTRDVSKVGAFVLTSSCPPVGAIVKMEILFPSFRIAGQSLKLLAEGRVVRVEHPAHSEAGNGFAVFSEGFAIPGEWQS